MISCCYTWLITAITKLSKSSTKHINYVNWKRFKETSLGVMIYFEMLISDRQEWLSKANSLNFCHMFHYVISIRGQFHRETPSFPFMVFQREWSWTWTNKTLELTAHTPRIASNQTASNDACEQHEWSKKELDTSTPVRHHTATAGGHVLFHFELHCWISLTVVVK